MTCEQISVKSGDTAIEFTDTLTKDGVAVNLAGATVLFLLKLKSPPLTSHSLAATIVSAAAGTVKYAPGVGYPTVPGRYTQEWEVTFGDGTILTFPNRIYNYVTILEDLN